MMSAPLFQLHQTGLCLNANGEGGLFPSLLPQTGAWVSIHTALMPESCWLSCSTTAMIRGCRWVRLPRSWSKDIGRSLSNFRFSSFSSASASDTSAQPVRRFRPGGGECQALWNLRGGPLLARWGGGMGLG